MTVPLENVFDIPDHNDNLTASIHELYALIGRLEPFEKALITLWLDEKSYDDLALILGITKTNVATRLSRIKAKLSSMTNS